LSHYQKLISTRRAVTNYPVFLLVHQLEGYEIKGLAWSGSERDYDANTFSVVTRPRRLAKGNTLSSIWLFATGIF
jgi:hypothetical protein